MVKCSSCHGERMVWVTRLYPPSMHPSHNTNSTSSTTISTIRQSTILRQLTYPTVAEDIFLLAFTRIKGTIGPAIDYWFIILKESHTRMSRMHKINQDFVSTLKVEDTRIGHTTSEDMNRVEKIASSTNSQIEQRTNDLLVSRRILVGEKRLFFRGKSRDLRQYGLAGIFPNCLWGKFAKSHLTLIQ